MRLSFPDYCLTLEDTEFTEPKFSFPGFSKTGFCFLKISIQKGWPVFFCVQLRNYSGTSITNAAEEIFQQAILKLLNNGAVVSTRKKTFSDFLSNEKFEQKKKRDLVRFFTEKSLWIEHYPPDVGIDPNGMFSIVKFDSHLHPSWSFIPKEKLVRLSGLNESFFDLPDEY